MGQIVDFLADVGNTLEKHLSSEGIAILVVLLAWIHHGLSAIFVTLLVASAYVRRRSGEAVPAEAEVEETTKRGNGDFALIIGVILVLGGIYWLIKEIFPQIEVNWPIALIILGALLVLLGLREKGERK
ncbi:MAG: hypothetical protein J7J65_00200 [Candidatus Korarchaeota archaeon]|nr:hypothetical protein [Candidatus Korarchaeota archaeon]